MKKRSNFSQQIISSSTLEFTRESRRIPGNTHYSLFDFLHGYIYARWPYLYIGIGVGEHPLVRRFGPLFIRVKQWFQRSGSPRHEGSSLSEPESDVLAHKPGTHSDVTFADTYHGKVVPLEAATQLVMVNEPVQILDLERIIPYQKARDIILKSPDHIVALVCPCRLARPNPCLPLDVCLIVGEPFASFVLEHHPQRSRQISQKQAVKILEEEDARGHVHHAFFKDAMLGRFYAICNCCACCCGAMQAQRNGTPMLASSGYLATVDESLCIGCQVCRETCQFSALKLKGNVMGVLEDRCMGCGVCTSRCEQDAITLIPEPRKGEPLKIFELIEQASGQKI